MRRAAFKTAKMGAIIHGLTKTRAKIGHEETKPAHSRLFERAAFDILAIGAYVYAVRQRRYVHASHRLSFDFL
ncbi:MAG: hypothetical protein FWF44_07005 [Defluviitaleaceae bacterium]|nr:hypothetical protein [Defluviitaleaceae bacterium]